MRITIFLLALLFTAGCATPRQVAGAVPSGKADAGIADANYPFSEIEKVYEAALDGMTSKYFAQYPDIDKKHTEALRKYIAAEYPKSRFVKEMVRDEAVAIFERGQRDAAYRDTKEFRDTFAVTVSVSVSMAKMIMGGLRDTYVAKYVEMDPIKVELFRMAKTENERQCVSWVSREVTAEEFKKETGDKYELLPGDRVFAFCSPESTWTDLCGRQGYLHVRGISIVDIIVTMMN
jgi:hypothetical protein